VGLGGGVRAGVRGERLPRPQRDLAPGDARLGEDEAGPPHGREQLPQGARLGGLALQGVSIFSLMHHILWIEIKTGQANF